MWPMARPQCRVRVAGCGEATVTTHLVHTYAKLGIDDRTAAVMAALERGLLGPDR